jgi:hypothetical protein
MGKQWLGVILASRLIAPTSAAEGDRLLATTEVPALVTASRSVGTEAIKPHRAPRVIVGVTSYQPAHDGAPIRIVVKARDNDGAEREIGRFGIVPNTAFKASDPSRARRFGLPLPPGFSGNELLKLTIYVEPINGAGTGAQVQIGGAEVR